MSAGKIILTYNKGVFTLSEGTRETLVSKDFHAVKKYWPYADEKAERLLNRAFVKDYCLDRKLPSFLDPHQVAGVTWVLTRSRSYLAHAPGAGKTCEAIVASQMTPGMGQTVFIVPPQLTTNWEREIHKWTGELEGFCRWGYWPTVSVIPESKHQDFTGWKADFIICPDSMLAKPWVLKGLLTHVKFKFLAVDEASRFKDPKAERTIALFGGRLATGQIVPGFVYNLRHAVLLDGSPMPNRTMELWAPTFAMCPEAIDFMSEGEFGFKFCGPTLNKFHRWEFRFSSNERELQRRLQKKFMHVVSEEELNHPERRRTMLYMTKDARSPEMRKWEKENLERMKADFIGEEASQGQLAHFRKELGLRKVSWIAGYVKWRLETKNESILLFAWHREVVINLAFRLAKYCKARSVIGGTSAIERENTFKDFQNGKVKLIIGNIAAMGRGHNLQRADRVIFGEYSWTDELNKQCEKRASRKGSTKTIVRCDYVVSPNSIDEKILKSVFRKAESVKKVIG